MAIGNILVRVGANISDYEDKMKRVAKITDMSMSEATYAMQRTGGSIAKVGAAITGTSTALIGGATTIAAQYEQAFTNVKKVLDGTPEQFDALSLSIRNMAKEIPMSVFEIAELAETAGRLGVPIQEIEKFTRTTADLGVTTNMAAADAAEAFARFANIMDMPLSQVDRLGSTVVHLGNNLATSEREIVNMGLRMAGVGRTVGMTEAEVMSLAGAISATGIRAEAGGSAFTRVMNIINNAVGEGSEAVEGFAKVAGVSSDEFIQAFGDSPAQALSMFVDGLRKISDEGGNTAMAMNDLGIKGVYNHDLLNRLAGANDVLRNSLELGNQAWEENTALQDEANQRYGTFLSKLKVVGNRLLDIGLVFGNVFMDVFSDLIDKMEPILTYIEKLAAKFEESSDGFKKFVAIAALLTPVVGIFITFAGVLMIVTAKLVEAYRVFKSMTKIIRIVSTVFRGLGVVFSIAGIKIIAIVALIAGAVYLIIKYWDPIKAFFIDLWNKVSEVSIAVWEGIKAAWQAAVEFLTNLWNGISGFFTDLWNSITEVASNIWDTVLNAWISHVNFMMDLFSPLISYFKELWSTIVDTATTIWDTLTTSLSSIWNNIVTIASSTWDIIKNAILGPILLLINLATGDFEEFKSNLTAIWENIHNAGKRIWEAIKDAIVTISEAVYTITSKIWESFKNTVVSLVTALKETAVKVFNTLKTQAVEKISSLVVSGIKKFNELKSKAFEVITNMVKDLLRKWDDLKQQTLDKIKQVKNNVINPLKEINLLQIGKDVIVGFIKGIKSKVSAVADAAKEAADAVTGKIKSILRIKSPSRVMMSIGSDTMRGYEVGIEERKQAATKVVTNLFNGLLDIVKEATTKEREEITKNNAEIKKIEQRSAEDIQLIKNNATKAKRKLTEAERIKIRRLEEDTAKKIRDIQSKNYKLEQDMANVHADKMIEIANNYVKDKKWAGQMSASEEIYFWNAMYRNAEKGSKEYEEALKNHQSAVKNLRSEVESVMKDYNDRAISIEKEYLDQSKALHDEINKAYDDRLNQLLGFSGLFDTFEREMEKTGQDLIKSLETQVTALMDYSSAINDLDRRIDDEALMNELRAMGVGAVGELEALNRMSDTELEKYVTLYKQKFKLAKEQTDTELAPMTDSVDEKLKELRKNADKQLTQLAKEWADKINSVVKGTEKEFDSMYQVGLDAVEGLNNGLKAMQGALNSTANALANEVLDGIKKAFDINSPSRKTFGMGENVGEGLANGILRTINLVSSATDQLTEAAMPEVGKVDLSYSSANGRHSNLRKAISGNVNVQDDGDNKIVEAIEDLKDRMTDLTVQMDGQEVARLTNKHHGSMDVRRTTFRGRVRGVTI